MEVTHTSLENTAYKAGYYAGFTEKPQDQGLKDYCHKVMEHGERCGWSKTEREFGSYEDYQRGYADGVGRKAQVNEHLRHMRERLKMSNNQG